MHKARFYLKLIEQKRMENSEMQDLSEDIQINA